MTRFIEKPWEHWIAGLGRSRVRLKASTRGEAASSARRFFRFSRTVAIAVSGRGQGVDGAKSRSSSTTLNIEEGKRFRPAGRNSSGAGAGSRARCACGDRITVLGNTIRGSMNGIDLRVVGIYHTGQRSSTTSVFQASAQTGADSPRYGQNRVRGSRPGFARISPGFRRNSRRFSPARGHAVRDSRQSLLPELGRLAGLAVRIIQTIILTIVILGISIQSRPPSSSESPRSAIYARTAESSWEVLGLLVRRGRDPRRHFSRRWVWLLAWLVNATVLRNGI